MDAETTTRKVDKRWFQNVFAEKDITQAKLAKLIGMSGPALTRLLNGERRLQTNEAIAMASVLGVPLQDIFARIGQSTPKNELYATLRGIVEDDSRINVKCAHKNVPAPMAGLSALENPRLKWLFFYKPSSNVSPDAIGRLALVKPRANGHDEPRIMFVDLGSQPGYYDLKDPVTFKLTRDVPLESASPILFIKT